MISASPHSCAQFSFQNSRQKPVHLQMGLNDQPVSGTDDYYDLGSFQWPITTNSQDTQIWFNRGITWCYGFNHQEAVKCFERAISHDRTCAIAHWGLSYAAGPNYNKPWQIFDKTDLLESLRKTHQAAKDARHNIGSASPIERALIEAVQSRYPDDKPQTSYSARNKAYANAMAKVYKSFSTNLDIAALYTDSLMSLTAWALWDLRTGQARERGSHARSQSRAGTRLCPSCFRQPPWLDTLLHSSHGDVTYSRGSS